MQPPNMPLTADITPSRVEVNAVSEQTVVVTLLGDQDLPVHGRLRAVLLRAGASRRVLVDLSPCGFIDSTVIAILLNARSRNGRRVELVVPNSGSVARTLNLIRVHKLLTVHETLDAALNCDAMLDASDEQSGTPAEVPPVRAAGWR